MTTSTTKVSPYGLVLRKWRGARVILGLVLGALFALCLLLILWGTGSLYTTLVLIAVGAGWVIGLTDVARAARE